MVSHRFIRSRAALLGSLFFGISHSFAQQPNIVKNIELISFGGYTTENLEQRAAEKSVTYTVNAVAKPVLLNQTDVIQGRLGSSFGFEYKIIGTSHDSPLRVVVMIEHPLLVNPRTGRSDTLTQFEIPGRIGAL